MKTSADEKIIPALEGENYTNKFLDVQLYLRLVYRNLETA